MSRIRLCQVLPFLLPLRVKQRKFFYYKKMELSKIDYAQNQNDLDFKHLIKQDKSLLINTNSGYDIEYQYNKVANLKLAALTLNNLQIKPNETFSFWHSIKRSYELGIYKDGLILIDGKIKTTKAGGLCQLSQMLYWLFVHSDLTITENHSHQVQSFHVPKSNIPLGMESSVSEGWQDLQATNITNNTFQINIEFDDDYIYISLSSLQNLDYTYDIVETDNYYYTKDNKNYYHNKIYKCLKRHNSYYSKSLLKENNILLNYDYTKYLDEVQL